MNNVIVMGVSYKTAPVEVRERLAVSQRSLADALEGLRGLPGSDEVAFLSTCNRVEVVARPGALASAHPIPSLPRSGVPLAPPRDCPRGAGPGPLRSRGGATRCAISSAWRRAWTR